MIRFLQDQHLHNFFQHCQNMEMSEQATEGELVKYLKVLKASLIWNALRKLQHALLFMSNRFEHRAKVLYTFPNYIKAGPLYMALLSVCILTVSICKNIFRP